MADLSLLASRELSVTSREDAVIEAHNRAMGYLLGRAHSLFRLRLTQAIEGTRLHMGHVVILASLYAENDLTQSQLTQICHVEKSSVVLFLDALEKDGWVERRRHPTDRRAHCVHLTASGTQRFTDIGQRLHLLETQNLTCFTPEERTQLEALLLRLVGHLEALSA